MEEHTDLLMEELRLGDTNHRNDEYVKSTGQAGNKWIDYFIEEEFDKVTEETAKA